MYREFLERLASTNDGKLRRTIVEIAALFDEQMLLCATAPDDAVEFLVELFSNQRVLGVGGLEHFLLEMSVDACKYTASQLGRILETLIANSVHVADELVRHSIGDFIARAYSPDIAFQSLNELSKLTARQVHIAFVGLDVLRKNVPVCDPLYAAIEKRWVELMRSAPE